MGYLNTGTQIINQLKQIAVYRNGDRIPTGVTKPNVVGDPDYIAPIHDATSEAACPAPPACGDPVTFSGTGKYYPKTFQIQVGIDTGPFLFTYGAGPAPDKFVVRFNNTVLFDSGYVGDPGHFQASINAALAAMGLPPETVTDSDGRLNSLGGVGNGNGGIVLNKSTAGQYIFVDVYAILSGTNFTFSVGCPNGTYYSTDRTADFTRDNCTPPQTGSTVSYTKTYYSQNSQAEADSGAAADTIYDQRGQAYANANGTCS